LTESLTLKLLLLQSLTLRLLLLHHARALLDLLQSSALQLSLLATRLRATPLLRLSSYRARKVRSLAGRRSACFIDDGYCWQAQSCRNQAC